MKRFKKIGMLPLAALLCLGVYCGVKGPLEKQIQEGRRGRGISVKPVRASFHVDSLKRYHFGFKNLLASLIWVDLLQRYEDVKLGEGEVSWEYAQLAGIVSLDPQFYRAYDFGSVYLSVLRGDKLGAKLIMEEWIRARPSYWRAYYVYAYHLIYETNDLTAASKNIFTAARMEGSPYWLNSLGVRLLSEGGAYTHALNVSLQLIDQISDDRAMDRVVRRIRSLNYHIQEQAWKHAITQFQEKSGRAPRNLQEVRPLYQEKMRKELAWLNPAGLSQRQALVLKEQFQFKLSGAGRGIASLESKASLDIDKVGIYRPGTANPEE